MQCQRNPIYCKIKTLNPKVNTEFALRLSGLISKYSRMFGTDPMLSVAIAMQETAFVNKNRSTKGRVTDVGVFQLHVDTIAYLGIDIERLKVDVDYQTYWHTKILKSKIRTCTAQRVKLEVEQGSEWACYHSFTPTKRQVYIEDVGAYLAVARL